MPANKKLKICLVCSVGGHLTQILALSSFYEKHDYYFISFYRESIKEFIKQEQFYIITDPSRNFLNFIINFFQSIKLFIKNKPDVIISTGAGVAIASCFLGWLFRKKVIFIEDWCRIEKPSISGLIVYPISNLFFIQWPNLIRYYPKAIYKGTLI